VDSGIAIRVNWRSLVWAGAFALIAASPISAEVSASEIQAPEAMVPVTRAEQTHFCERFIKEKLDLWRARLKLEDWKISVAMSQRNQLKPRTLGGIHWDKRKKTATISVLDPSEYRLPFREMLEDMEFTIVHELVHLELASLPRSEASRSNEEHAVNRMTEALLALDRQKHHTNPSD
jgi:hypothetical protein